MCSPKVRCFLASSKKFVVIFMQVKFNTRCIASVIDSRLLLVFLNYHDANMQIQLINPINSQLTLLELGVDKVRDYCVLDCV